MIERIAHHCFRHRWRTLFAWIALLGALIVGGGRIAGEFADGGRLQGTDSDAAYELLGSSSPATPGESVTIAYGTASGGRLDSPAARETIASFVRDAGRVEHVKEVGGPTELSEDGTVGIGELVVIGSEDEQLSAVNPLRDLAQAAEASGVSIDYASWGFTEGGLNGSAEIVGVVTAIVILMLAFGSVIAMGVPIISALMGVAGATAAVGLWAAAVPTPDFTTEVAVMIGLGVGIDYAVFIITRYRRALAMGSTPDEAIVEAMGTAGRAVVFAGAIVMVSLLGMVLMGLSFFNGLALGSATAVLIAVVAAVTLVPALLSIAGRRIGARAVRVAHSTRETFWHRWARFVQRHAVGSAILGSGILLAFAAPVVSMRLASADLGSTAQGTTTRTAHDRLAAAFGPGINGPLVIAVATPDDAAKAGLRELERSVARTEGVAQVLPTQMSADGRVAQITVLPASGPSDAATTQLVHRLRDGFAQPGSLTAHVGGSTASDIDFADLMGRRLPVFIGTVLAASFLLLMLVFRSVLVPLKAVVLNLMSIGAAYGLMVAVFQWGWFGSLFGVAEGAPIEPWAPMMLFAIVFGLSIDYEVFLLSAVHERFRRTGDNSGAVVEGLSQTARVITAAAAIMVAVFGAFVANDLRSLKLIGFGLAAAVLVDATIVRMLLVPATMELLGARNWWMPRWLDRVLPTLHIEDHRVRPPAATVVAGRPGVAPEPAVRDLIGAGRRS